MRPLQAKVEDKLFDAISETCKARGQTKNEFITSALQNALEKHAHPPVEPEIKEPVQTTRNDGVADILLEIFRFLIPLREDVADDEAARIMSLFKKYKTASQETQNELVNGSQL